MLLNNELEITLPEGFRDMTPEEMAGLNVYKEAPGVSVKDPDRHIVISAAWKKSGLAALMLSAKEVAKKMESTLRGAMKPYGYVLDSFITENIGKETAEGFRYRYTAQNIRMVGETLSVKKGRTFYYIHCYLREELREESLQTLEEIFQSARWL